MTNDSTLLDGGDSLLVMIDVQQNHYPAVTDGEETLRRLVRLLRAAREIDEVALLWTEHYPRAFGPTLPPVAGALGGLEPIAKTAFGCFGEPRFARAVEAAGRGTVVLCGTETHICIQQTALQALDTGRRVAVVADCVTSRAARDHHVALRRMERAGVVLVTWEALVYEWMRGAGHAAFKRVLPIVKEG